MKKIIATMIGLATAISLHAQGTVAFANTTLTKITSIAQPLGISPANAFHIGLYVGPRGTLEDNLVLVSSGATGNAPIAGLFNGGNPFTLPAPFALGSEIAFQVRAWSTAGGNSYEAAVASGIAGILVGKSAMGSSFVNPNPALASNLPGGGAAPAMVLFGTTFQGQIGGFSVALVPEPSTIALALLGGALLLFRRRK